MKILGIDPGYAILGYGVVEKLGNKFKVCRYGAVTTDASMPMTQRLEPVSYTHLDQIHRKHHRKPVFFRKQRHHKPCEEYI